MKFQGLAVVLAKRKWPDLVACERKKDLGADAIAKACLAAEGSGKVLASSLTATLEKIRDDATKIRAHFGNTKILVFATPQKVTNQMAENWVAEIRKEFGYELVVMPREDIITDLMMPMNASLCRALGIAIEIEQTLEELIQQSARSGLCSRSRRERSLST